LSEDAARAPRPQQEGSSKSEAKVKPGARGADATTRSLATASGAAGVSSAGSMRETPATAANAMSVAHCAERKEHGDENMAERE
jgi:hypothetical protein